jgi:hypothetical protein
MYPVYRSKEMSVNDQASWDQAVDAVSKTFSSLSPESGSELNGLIDGIMQLKQNLVELVLSAGSADICRTCGGECCGHGKYHVSMLDIMAYEKNGTAPVVPDFSTDPYCPYSDASGCTMAPCYRPLTCVVFNCQLVEGQLTPAQQETFRGYEQELRAAVTRAGRITALRLDRALLLSCS